MKLPLESAETACLENASSIIKCLGEGGRCDASPRDRTPPAKSWGQLLQASQYKFALKKERKTKVRSGFDLREKECHFAAAPLQRLPGMAAANLFQQ